MKTLPKLVKERNELRTAIKVPSEHGDYGMAKKRIEELNHQIARIQHAGIGKLDKARAQRDELKLTRFNRSHVDLNLNKATIEQLTEAKTKIELAISRLIAKGENNEY